MSWGRHVVRLTVIKQEAFGVSLLTSNIVGTLERVTGHELKIETLGLHQY